MSKVYRFAIHQGAPAYDALDAEGTTDLDRIARDAACAKGTVEPDATHAALAALIYDIQGIARMRGNHHTVDTTGGRSQVRTATLALDLGRRGVQRKDLEP